MIGLSFVVLALGTFALSFAAANVLAAATTGFFLSAYVYFLILDCRQICASNDSFGIAGSLKTELGMRIGNKVAALLASKKSLHWQATQTLALANGIKSDRLYLELISNSNWRTDGVPALASRAARYVKARTRCSGAAIRIVSETQGEATAMLGAEGERLSALLRRVHARFAQKIAVESDLASFQSFGYSRSLIRHCCDATGGVGTIWLGYDNSTQPNNAEEKFVDELSAALTEELRYAERLQEVIKPSNDSCSDELAKFSHDIRSPLNNVKAILALLKLEALRTESVELLDVALSNCRGAEAIVEDVIDFSRHRAGKLSQKSEIIDMREILEEVIEGYRVAARMKGLGLTLECSSTVVSITADRNQIRRVFTNLISNALKYTRYGNVTVSLCHSNGNKVLISVRDTGVGIFPEHLKILFTPFTRFNSGGIEGNGLGLSIVKILVEGNAGEIEVRSKVGAGSEFVVQFPAHAVNSVSTDDAVITPHASIVRILLVDDDTDLVRSLAKLLERDGFCVLQSVTVQDAISILNFDPPNLVISDAVMPEGGGKRILSAIASSQSLLPVIIFSGDSGRAQELKALGATAVLEKPCDYARLKKIIAELLRPISSAATA